MAQLSTAGRVVFQQRTTQKQQEIKKKKKEAESRIERRGAGRKRLMCCCVLSDCHVEALRCSQSLSNSLCCHSLYVLSQQLVLFCRGTKYMRCSSTRKGATFLLFTHSLWSPTEQLCIQWKQKYEMAFGYFLITESQVSTRRQQKKKSLSWIFKW